MKIDSSGFGELVRLRQRLGAAESHHSYSKVLDPLEEITIELATAGIEVALSDIQEVVLRSCIFTPQTLAKRLL